MSNIEFLRAPAPPEFEFSSPCEILDLTAKREVIARKNNLRLYGVISVSAELESVYQPLRLVGPDERVMTYGYDPNRAL